MKKIGILTYYRYENYGTVLQAFALRRRVADATGGDAELIDYRSENEYVGRKLWATRCKRIFLYLGNFGRYYALWRGREARRKRAALFERFFEERLVLSKERAGSLDETKRICSNYRMVMIGSDQTWNARVTAWRTFLLKYVDDPNLSKTAYAPSLGTGNIPDELTETFVDALADFKKLSCRERGGAAVLSRLLKRDVFCALDPTLLLGPAEWEELASPEPVDRPYMLLYFLGDVKSHRETAKKIAAERNLKIVATPISYLEMNNKKIDRRYVGPGGFLSLLKNAAFVCTDSFHGTIFSINFGREFAAFPKRSDADANSDNNRIYDALETFGLSSRLAVGGKVDLSPIDWERVERILSEKRVASQRFLRECLEV